MYQASGTLGQFKYQFSLFPVTDTRQGKVRAGQGRKSSVSRLREMEFHLQIGGTGGGRMVGSERAGGGGITHDLC